MFCDTRCKRDVGFNILFDISKLRLNAAHNYVKLKMRISPVRSQRRLLVIATGMSCTGIILDVLTRISWETRSLWNRCLIASNLSTWYTTHRLVFTGTVPKLRSGAQQLIPRRGRRLQHRGPLRLHYMSSARCSRRRR